MQDLNNYYRSIYYMVNIRDSKILFINLKQSTERKITMIKQLRNLKVDFDWINAVDGMKLKEEEYRKEISKSIYIDYDKLCPTYWTNKKNFRSYSSDEDNILPRIGCWLSHYKAIQQAYLLGYDSVLILEDDAILQDNFMCDFVVPQNTDVLYFGGTFFRTDVSLEKDGVNLINPNKLKLFGLFGYYIPSKDRIQQIYNFLKTTFKDGQGHYNVDYNKLDKRVVASNIDKMFVDYIQKQGSASYLLPVRISHPEFEYDTSTIDNSSKYKKRYGASFT